MKISYHIPTFIISILGLLSLTILMAYQSYYLLAAIICIASLGQILFFLPIEFIKNEKEMIIKFVLRNIIIKNETIVEFRKSHLNVFLIPKTIFTSGYFGFIGSNMDGSSLYITDSRSMFYIRTKDGEQYYLSLKD